MSSRRILFLFALLFVSFVAFPRFGYAALGSGDVNNDSRVDISDIKLILASYSKIASVALDQFIDNKVNLADFAVPVRIITSTPTPEPSGIALSPTPIPSICPVADVTSPTPPAGVPDPDVTTDVTYYVNNQIKNASDSNLANNSLAFPFLTVNRGITAALDQLRLGKTATVMIAPGDYREKVWIPGGADIEKLLVIKGSGRGVNIKGSDDWSLNWESVGNSIFRKPWTTPITPDPIPPTWPPDVQARVQDIIRRRELVVVDGTNLDQVLNQADLHSGSFYIDDANGYIYVIPPISLSTNDLNQMKVEVGVRDGAFATGDKKNLLISDITISQSAGSVMAGQALWLAASQYVTLNNVTIEKNGGAGLNLSRGEHHYYKNLVIKESGATGLGGSRINDFVIDGAQILGNNWRGYRGNWIDWSVGGGKQLYVLNSTYANVYSANNYSYGYRCDIGCSNFNLVNSNFFNNLKQGISIDVSHGPIKISHAIAANNTLDGVVIGNVTNGQINDSILYNNGRSQFYNTGTGTSRDSLDWKTNQTFPVQNTNWNIVRTIFSAKGSNKLIDSTFNRTYFDLFINSSTVNNNVWYHATDTAPFEYSSDQFISFTQWKTNTGKDSNSVFTDPRFSDPDNNNFSMPACIIPGP